MTGPPILEVRASDGFPAKVEAACSRCAYSTPRDLSGDRDWHQCRRHAPDYVKSYVDADAYPIVTGSHWCGDFTPDRTTLGKI